MYTTHMHTHSKEEHGLQDPTLRLLLNCARYFFRFKRDHAMPNEAFQNEQCFTFSSAFSRGSKSGQEKACLPD